MDAGPLKKQRKSHIWAREKNEHYVEMRWCNRVLFQNVPFTGFIHDPCCGWGRIPWEARLAGHIGVTGSDIVDRGFEGGGIVDFLTTTEDHDNLVFNPPFNIMKRFIQHACAHTRGKVASIMQVKRLAAAHWMLERQLGLTEILYLTPRPSMPPGIVVEELMISLGKDPSGDNQDYCWLIFDPKRTEIRPPVSGWLHRDKGRLS